MAWTLDLRPRAESDVVSAGKRYELLRRGLGGEFIEAVSATLRAVAEAPLQFPIAHRDTRRALLQRFPYNIYFRIRGHVVVVVAVQHGRRHPQRWQVRDGVNTYRLPVHREGADEGGRIGLPG